MTFLSTKNFREDQHNREDDKIAHEDITKQGDNKTKPNLIILKKIGQNFSTNQLHLCFLRKKKRQTRPTCNNFQIEKNSL